MSNIKIIAILAALAAICLLILEQTSAASADAQLGGSSQVNSNTNLTDKTIDQMLTNMNTELKGILTSVAGQGGTIRGGIDLARRAVNALLTQLNNILNTVPVLG